MSLCQGLARPTKLGDALNTHLGTAEEVLERLEDAKALYTHPMPEAYGLGVAVFAKGGRLVTVDFCGNVNMGAHPGVFALVAEMMGQSSIASGTHKLTNDFLALVARTLAPVRQDGNDHPNLDVIETIVARGKVPPGVRQFQLAKGYLELPVLAVINSLQDPPVDAVDALLRLELISRGYVKPHEISLDGVFGLLNNVAWTDALPVLAEDYDRYRRECLARGERAPVALMVDKFPTALRYVVPPETRVMGFVRLGAHLAPKTVVMPAGSVNFNAGTLGQSMVEGRISAGVVVGDGSDLGGGSSTMGTLSGGGKQVISIGKRCLIGANGGTGISLGDDCRVEAGLYVTAGMPVYVMGVPGVDRAVKAAQLSGLSGLTFTRNSNTGRVEVKPTKGVVKLNAALHDDN